MLILFNLFCGALIIKMRSVTAVIIIVAIPAALMILYMRHNKAPTGPKPSSKDDADEEDTDEHRDPATSSPDPETDSAKKELL